MEHYAGIDVSLEQSSICVVDASGRIVREAKVASDPEALASWFAVDTLGHLLALHVTPANADDRAEVARLSKAMQAATGSSVSVAFVDQGYTGKKAEQAAKEHGIKLDVVKLPETKRGFVLLPRRWVVERSFAWATRFRHLVKDYGRYASTLADLHLVAFACLMLKQAALLQPSP